MRLLSLLLFFLLAPLATANDPAEPLWRDALSFLDAGRWERADGAFAELIRRYPDSDLVDGALWQRLELARGGSDELYLARLIDCLTHLHQPELRGRTALELARFFRDRGLSDWAVRAYAHRLSLPGEDGRTEAEQWLRFRGGREILVPDRVSFPLRAKDLTKIKHLLQARERMAENYAGADLQYWEEILNDGETDLPGTRRKLLRFLELYPESPARPRVYLLLARLEERLGNPASAMNLLRSALAQSRDGDFRPEMEGALGMMLLRRRDFRQALPHLEAGGRILAAATAAAALGDRERARNHARAACIHFGVLCLTQRTQLPEVLPRYRHRLPQRNLNDLLTLDGRIRDELQQAEQWLEEDPGRALEHFQRALAADPRHDGARLGIVLASLLRGTPGGGNEALQTLLSRYPTDTDLLDLEILQASSLQQTDREGRALFRRLALDPGPVRARLSELAREGVDFRWPADSSR